MEPQAQVAGPYAIRVLPRGESTVTPRATCSPHYPALPAPAPVDRPHLHAVAIHSVCEARDHTTHQQQQEAAMEAAVEGDAPATSTGPGTGPGAGPGTGPSTGEAAGAGAGGGAGAGPGAGAGAAAGLAGAAGLLAKADALAEAGASTGSSWGLRVAQAVFVIVCVAFLIRALHERSTRRPPHTNTGRAWKSDGKRKKRGREGEERREGERTRGRRRRSERAGGHSPIRAVRLGTRTRGGSP